ncbi:MAG: hypothetical protein GY928_26755, partial [Colwellia sp.]|nr:hypothetical protein [Colwellia sp.]
PEAIKKRIAQLKEEKKKWDSWHTDPALVAELKGEGFELKQETEQDRRDREQKQLEATKKQSDQDKLADDKAKADKDVDDFTLTGSTATADELEARGQDTLFDEKADYENLSSTKAEAHKSPKKSADKAVDTLEKLKGSMLANSIAKDYKEKGVISLIGQRIDGSEDLAVLAQIYRNPSFETFRFFFTKGRFIVGQTGVTSRMPGETKLFPDKQGYDAGLREMKEQMKRLGADGYYMMHNHPSGSMTPSVADKNATKSISKHIKGFKGHIIVNQKQYVIIDVDMLWESKKITNLDPEYDINKPAKSGEMLGKRISGPDDVALVGTEYYRPDWLVIVGRRGSSGKVSGIMEVPISAIESRTPLQLAAYIRAFQRKTGSVDVSVANVPTKDPYTRVYAKVRYGLQKGWLLDAISIDGKSLGGPIYREGSPDHKAVDVALKERDDIYYSTTFVPRETKAVKVSMMEEVKPPKGKEGVTINVKDQTVFGMKIDTNVKKKSKGTVKKDSDIFYAPG